jgi:hypothetical protein
VWISAVERLTHDRLCEEPVTIGIGTMGEGSFDGPTALTPAQVRNRKAALAVALALVYEIEAR